MDEVAAYERSTLRTAVLARAIVVLRDRGVGVLSLRRLATDLGVSHAAPARHFPDRQKLLEALAEEGFAMLAARLRTAVAAAGDPAEQMRLAAYAYIDFATVEANLTDVMYQHDMYQHDSQREKTVVGRSAQTAFAPLLEVFQRGEVLGVVSRGGAEQAATLFLALLQGIAALVSCGVATPENLPGLIDDAVPRFATVPNED